MRKTGGPSTAEMRTIEDIYEALQFDPMNVSNIGNRRFALGVAALVLKQDFEHEAEYIAPLLKCSAKGIPELIAHASEILGKSPAIVALVASIRAQVATYKQDAAPKPPPKRDRVRPPRKDPKEPRKNARCCVGGCGMQELAEKIAEATGVSVQEMRGDERGLRESNARAIAMAVAAVLHPSWNPKDIAAYFRRIVGDFNFSRVRVSRAIRLKSQTSLFRMTTVACIQIGLECERLVLPKDRPTLV